jgi:transcription-repair coupling factor (superfamily II helicase)
LIVDRADTFGLAQLYQLRGRVGRGAARAHAYFFTDRRHRPTPDAYQRLETLAEQTDLGAGYGIAMRDLEMRGAGDILGIRQHGHIASVGFHLYTRLLADSVRRLRAAPAEAAGAPEPAGPEAGDLVLGTPVTVDLPISAVIPSDYIPDRGLRLRLYRRLADIRTEDEIAGVGLELADRFGPLPAPVENLLYQLQVKLLAGRAGATAIGSENGQVLITVPDLAELDAVDLAAGLGTEVRASKSRLWLGRTGGEAREPDAAWRRELIRLLRLLAEVRERAARSGESAGR